MRTLQLMALLLLAAGLSITGCEKGGSDSGGGGGGGGGHSATSAEADLAQQVLTLVNQERSTQSLAPMTWHTGCAQVAFEHSWDMDARDFFSHTNPDGKSPFDRMQAAGISYSGAAENIAAGYGSAAAVMNGWMNSPGHRANILSPTLTEIGIGVRQGSTGQYGMYWTQVFRRP